MIRFPPPAAGKREIRVLLVEASASEAGLLQMLFSRTNATVHKVTRAETVDEALEVLDAAEFDVVLLDLNVTGTPGLDPLRRLHGRTAAAHIPIVVMTEDAQEELALQALQGGAQEYLVRGEFQARALVRTIQRAIDRQQMLSQLGESLERELYLGSHDSLTGLPNRYLFNDRLSQALLGHSRRQGWLGVLYLNLDRFKSVNETLGHAAGDQLIQSVARRLVACLRSSDSTARLGSDEFAVLLPQMSQGLDAAKVAQNIERALEKPFRLAGREAHVSVSIGIAISPDDGAEPEALITNAEAAMRHAKNAGGRGHCFYTSRMNASSHRLLTLEGHLQEAIEKGELSLHYQPIVDGRTGRMISSEALVRWKHPDFGMIPPNDFIPIAETRGLIAQLGAWVLRTVCRQIVDWRENGCQSVPVAVNVSPKQFLDTDFLGLVMQTLMDSGIDGAELHLEITESCVMRDVDMVVEALLALKQLNIRFAIDDFGTGFSSLNVLRKLPLDSLKIDRSFVRDAAEDEGSATVISAVIGLANNLGLEVIAEGVETEQDRQLLLQRGCTHMQGFYFARPQPIGEFTRMLLAGQNFLPELKLTA
jgi:diguanylate cyclase (GGDEF)-like protein